MRPSIILLSLLMAIGVTTLQAQDTIPPAPATGFRVANPGLGNRLDLSWTNPTDADFNGVLILRRLGDWPTGVPQRGTGYVGGMLLGDAEIVYLGPDRVTFEFDLLSDQDYDYVLFAFDYAFNYSAGVRGTARTTPFLAFSAPVVKVVSPRPDWTIGGAYEVAADLYDPDGLARTSPCEISFDSTTWVAMTLDDAVYPGDARSGFYTFIWNTVADSGTLNLRAPGTFWVRATDARGNQSIAPRVAVNLANLGGEDLGDGSLLIRNRDAELCVACHDLPNHDMRATGSAMPFSADCYDCHTAHGTRNIYLVRESLMTSSGILPVVFRHKSGLAGGAEAGLMGDATDSVFSNICEVCHTRTTQFRNTSGNVWSEHYNGANCTLCHRHENGFRPSGDCATCHPAPPRTGAHAAHYALGTLPTFYTGYANRSDPLTYSFECGKCHSSGAGADHLNGPVSSIQTAQVFFDATNLPASTSGLYHPGSTGAVDSVGMNYTVDGTCSNVYCHGDFPGSGIVGNTPHWDGTADCGSCHGADNTTPPAGGSHAKHVGVYTYQCDRCHASTFTTYTTYRTNTQDRTIHVNGAVDWSMHVGETYRGEVAGARNPFGSPYGSCANVYCHSDGMTPVVSHSTPQWGNTLGCNGCHGTGTTTGRPDHRNGGPGTATANSHSNHSSYGCQSCHAATTTDGRTISSPANHTDNLRQVQGARIASYNPATKTCSGVSCHGGGSAQWGGGDFLCTDCHARSTAAGGDQDDWTYGNDIPAQIDSDQWVFSGHGHSGSPFLSGNESADLTCETCHARAVVHGTSENPFRLTTADVDSLCAMCHPASSVLSHNQNGIAAYYTGASCGSTPAWNQRCTDCHDPHGDGNWYMVGDSVVLVSDSLGFPVVSAPVTFHRAGTTWAGSDYVDNSSPVTDGLCQVCHTQACVDYYSSGQTSTHNPASDCKTCHAHNKSFAPAGACNACHGLPPDNGPQDAHREHYQTDLAPTHYGQAANYSTASHYIFGCGKCHNPPSALHMDGNVSAIQSAQVFFNDSLEPRLNILATYAPGRAGATDATSLAFTLGGTCTNLYCHGDFAGSGNVANTPSWNGTASCGTCHGANNLTPPSGGSHAKHVGQYAMPCDRCHASTFTDYIDYANNLWDCTVHVNGSTDWSLETGERYHGSQAGSKNPPSTDYFTCTTVYCHSDGQNPTTYHESPRWGQTLACNGCHGISTPDGRPDHPNGGPGAPGANSHGEHPGLSCGTCHTPTTGSGSTIVAPGLHTDGSVEVGGPSIGSWDSTTQTCRNIVCHGGHDATWGQTIDQCSSCHLRSTGDLENWVHGDGTLSRVDSTQWVGAGHGHAGSYPSGNTGAALECTSCHTFGVPHGVSGNPFRLTQSDPNALCASCHGTTELTHSQQTITSSWSLASCLSDPLWSQKCTDCHDPHGGNNWYMVGDSVRLASDTHGIPSTSRAVVFTRAGTTWTGSDYVDTSAPITNKLCQVCHVESCVDHYPSGGADGHNASRDCKECHTHAHGFAPPTGGTCNACHDAPPDNGVSDAHTAHYNSAALPTMYGDAANLSTRDAVIFGCGKCHQPPATTHQGGAVSANQTAEVAFDNAVEPEAGSGAAYHAGATGATDAFGMHYTLGGNCSNVYCHGSFAGSGNAANTTSWNGLAECGTCHGANNATPPSGGSHAKHVGVYTMACDRCHASTFTTYVTYGTNVKDRTIHANGATNWSMNSGETYSGASTGSKNPPSTTYATCATVYCHSAGTNPPSGYRTPQWGTTLGCNGCHGTGNSVGRPDHPNGGPGTATANSHGNHSGYGCQECHAATTTTGTTITNLANHADNVRQVSGSQIGSYNPATKTCSAVACHGGDSGQWGGGDFLCSTCHDRTQSAGGDLRNWTFGDGTLARIDSDQWVSTGHGRTSGSYLSGNSAGNLACAACHSSAVAHDDASNPFRLTNSDIASLCAGCHSASVASTHSEVNVSAWSGASCNLTPDWTQKCTDCHDPHGDASAYMVGDSVSLTSNTFGVPTSSRAVVFTRAGTSWTGTDYVDNTAPVTNGLCQVCHTQGCVAHYPAGSGDGHNLTADCKTCHAHDHGFAPTGGACNACHDAPPDNGSADAHTAHYASRAIPTAYGDPLNHSTADTLTYGCGKCHASPTATHQDGAVGANQSAEVAFDSSVDPEVGLSAHYSAGSSGATDAHGMRYTVGGTCASTYCHGNFAGSGNASNTPTWNGLAACGSCHGADNTTPPAGGSHAKHVGVYTYQCNRCHASTFTTYVTYGTNVKDRTIHANGSANWSMNSGETYSGARTGSKNPPSTTYATCATVYCHSDGMNPVVSYRTPQWGTTLSCNGCHGTTQATGAPDHANGGAGTPTANSHSNHAAYGCQECHAATTTDGSTITSPAMHTNGSREVQGPQIGAYDPSLKTCSGVSCHGGVTARWGGSIEECASCHVRSTLAGGDHADWVYGNTVPAMIDSNQWTTTGHGRPSGTYASGNAAAGMACGICHTGTVEHGTSTNPFRLQNPDPNALCASCHAGTAIETHSQGNIQSSWAGASCSLTPAWLQKCTDCHDPHGDRNWYMVPDSVRLTSDVYGRPLTVQAVTFTRAGTSWTGTDYVDNTAPVTNGLCQVCHTNGCVAHYPAGSGDGHNLTADCKTCHAHDHGFAPTGGACNACHDAPPDNGSTDAHTAHYASRAIPTAYGDPLNHSTADTLIYGCGKCHATPGAIHQDGAVGANQTAEVAFDSSVDPEAGLSAHYNAGSTGATDAHGMRYTVGGTCASTYCHGNFAGSGNASNTPTWNGLAACGTCHGADNTTPPAGGSHAKHVGTYTYQCNRCHASTFTTYTTYGSNTRDYTIHANGAANWSMNAGETYSGASTGSKNPPSTTYATCATVYCHSAGTNPPSGYRTPQWGTTLGCNGCHGTGNSAGRPSSGRHSDHSGRACSTCHNQTVSGSTTIIDYSRHCNNIREVSGTEITSYNPSTHACSPTCHDPETWR